MMKDLTITGIGLAIWSGLSYLLGGRDIPLESFAILVLIDLLTGVYAASVQHTVSARILVDGFIRKMFLFLIISMAVMIDNSTLDAFHLRTFAIGVMALGEGVSICENLIKAGLQDIIPKPLVDKLITLSQKKE